ncbi:YcdB/YcdC domain-containing protein [Haloimpatiens sp. FM7315]|uniref:YcdB/YcdC domain-containing protein n=1 Tax=Haloimpatiens sp. FM7315 TaxID=3298609 RepID=UPI00370A5840
MNFKKISYVLAISLVISCLPLNTFAFSKKSGGEKNQKIVVTNKTTGISKDKAKSIAEKTIKEKLNITIDNSYNFRTEFRENYIDEHKNYAWYITVEKSTSFYNSNISLTIDSDTGKVLEIYVYEDSNNNDNNIASITEEEAKKISDDFLKKLCPKEALEVTCKDANKYGYHSYNNYEFLYTRMIKGIPFYDNSIRVTVDGTTGKIINYLNIWYDDIKINKDTKAKITEDQAKILFKDNLQMYPYYCYFSNNYSEKGFVIKPVFSVSYKKMPLIDAISSKWINHSYNINYTKLEKDLTEKEKENLFKKIKPIKNYDKELTKEEASKKILSLLKQIYNEDFKINKIDYLDNGVSETNGHGRISWFAQTSSNKDKRKEVNITINAENGTLVNLYKFTIYDPKDSNSNGKTSKEISFDEVYKKALDLILQNQPEKLKEVVTKQSYIKGNSNNNDNYRDEYCFIFNQKVNGISYLNNNISISYDIKTGELSNFDIYWNENIKFPSLDKFLSIKKANEIYLNKFSPILYYKYFKEKGKNPEIKLVYSLPVETPYYGNPYMDVFTGNLLSDTGEFLDENIDLFKEKIKGNKYEKLLSILAFNNIVDTRNFDPKKDITNMDLIKMLVLAKGYNVSLLEKTSSLNFKSNYDKEDINYKYLQLAVAYGILENKEGVFDSNGLVKRKTMAKSLIKVLGYEPLAKCTDMFKLNIADIKDIDKEDLGYMSIAKSLNILEIQDNKLNPNNNATTTELCYAIYNVLSNLRHN